MKLTPALIVATMSLFTVAGAQSAGTHEHGSATLNIAIEADIVIEFETPWVNLIGFEHSPQNSEQTALRDDALEKLNDPGQLFSFDGTDCVAVDVILESGLDTNLGAHSSVMVSYTLFCFDLPQLKNINMVMFDYWPALDNLNVQLIGPSGSTSAKLEKEQRLLDITQVQ